jgi:hypothetical protein
MQNKWLKYGLLALGVILLAGIVFGAGILVGRLSVRGSNPSSRLFQRGFLFSGAHGATGVIEEIQDKSLAVRLRDGTTQVILIDNSTRVERNLKKAGLGDLKVGDRIVVVGTPDPQGRLKARLIRVIDLKTPPPTPKAQIQ